MNQIQEISFTSQVEKSKIVAGVAVSFTPFFFPFSSQFLQSGEEILAIIFDG